MRQNRRQRKLGSSLDIRLCVISHPDKAKNPATAKDPGLNWPTCGSGPNPPIGHACETITSTARTSRMKFRLFRRSGKSASVRITSSNRSSTDRGHRDYTGDLLDWGRSLSLPVSPRAGLQPRVCKRGGESVGDEQQNGDELRLVGGMKQPAKWRSSEPLSER